MGGASGRWVNIGASYLLAEGDITPYVGGGVGYAFLFTGDFNPDPLAPTAGESGRSGFQVMLSGGLILLRTNEIRFSLNGDSMITASGHGDKAFVLTLGVSETSTGASF